MPKVSIYCVHGLGGSPLQTWETLHQLFRQDTELQECAELAFFTFPTKIVRLPCHLRSLRIQDLADAMATDIAARYRTDDTILIVAHSLGGLVAKRYITNQLRHGHPNPVKSVIFFATPHGGADIASLGTLLSWKHRHLVQLQRQSDLLEQLREDWASFECERKLRPVYVVGGQDTVVSRESSSGPSGARVELLADCSHSSVVRPNSAADLSFLIIKREALRIAHGDRSVITELGRHIAAADSARVTTVLSTLGRSLVESDQGAEFSHQLVKIVSGFAPNDPAHVWARFFQIIGDLFRAREAPTEQVDDSLIERAEQHGLHTLFMAERMELARKRGQQDEAARSGQDLLEAMKRTELPGDASQSYAQATSLYLLGNLYRDGGRYAEGLALIERAKATYRPAILSHQIELAHCEYGLAVCRIMTDAPPGDIHYMPLSPEFRQFAEGLIVLIHSHAAWMNGFLGEAADCAGSAAALFDRIGFTSYSKRARRTTQLIETWRKLELGARVDELPSFAGEDAPILQALIRDGGDHDLIASWIANARPARVIGLLQFASAFGPAWSTPMEPTTLCPILKIQAGRLQWERLVAGSLMDADRKLRLAMAIEPTAKLPLLLH